MAKYRLEGDIQISGPGFADRANVNLATVLTFTRHDGEIGMVQRGISLMEWNAMTPALRKHSQIEVFTDALMRDALMFEPDRYFMRHLIQRWAETVDWTATPTQQFFQLEPYVETRL